MANFLRHIGRHGDRKVAIVFREVPGEPHMALVVYTELLNRTMHDPLIRCIESDIGQSSEDLALALNRSYTTDGHIILQRLHAEGMLKKVQTELIIVTPTPNTSIKLSDLNKILDEMKTGEDAVKRLAEIDSQMGMQDPAAVARRMRGDRDVSATDNPYTTPTNLQSTGDALGDSALAANLRQQAERMSKEANGLLLEAQNLFEQARGLDPTVDAVTFETTAKKTKGRPKKVSVNS